MELVKGEKQWATTKHGESSCSAVHAEHAIIEEEPVAGNCNSDDDAILPLDDGGLKDIIKTVEVKVEK